MTGEHSENHVGIGLSNPKLSQTRRRMLDLVNRLHSTGVQVDIDLPQIAVIGSQSAGKSSLIESISGITLPRAAGTCTRCPTECRLSRSDGPWQCKVYLHFITDSQGQPLGQAKNEIFGGVITDKSQVEDRIRRAQKAILNPKFSPSHFLKHDEESRDSELSFSMNCVCLQISGPDVADLSFVDLPGLIASVSSNNKGGGNDIALVERLVTAYIKKPNCIILLTVACETDFENQGAHRLTKQYDPEGKRTIGVLTKPDRIPIGEEANWLPFIRNEKESLENSWFCVKQPSSNDLKSIESWAEARQMENVYFSSTAPWSELDSIYQKYLRTANLVERLSLVLSDLISKRLPQIYDELEQSIDSVRHALDALPRPPSDNPQSEISTLLHDFVTDLRQHVEGVPDVSGLLQVIRPVQERFRRTLRSTAPNFRPFERKYEGHRHIRRPKFLVEEEGRMEDDEASDNEDCTPTTTNVATTALSTPKLSSPHRKRTSSASRVPSVTSTPVPKGTFSFGAPQPQSQASLGSDGFEKFASHSTAFTFSAKSNGSAPSTGILTNTTTSSDSAPAASTQATRDPAGASQRAGQKTGQKTGQKRKYADVNKIYIDEVMDRAERARTRELPGHYPFRVQETFIKAFIQEWEGPALELCRKVHDYISEHVKKLVSEHFMFYGQGLLEHRIRTIMHQHIEKCRDRTENKIQWLLDIEDQPFSLNTHYLSDYKSKFLGYYRGERQRYDGSLLMKALSRQGGPGLFANDQNAESGEILSKVLAGLTELGLVGLAPEALQKLLPEDKMEPALGIMADVRAYFQVAFKRFADNVPSAIDYELVRGIERDVLKVLYAQLGINGPDGSEVARELSQESPQIADKRIDLTKKLERLEIAQRELSNMGV